jgi:predicted transcriptional regulator
MRKRQTDYVRVRSLWDEGFGVTEIAEKVGRTKGTISKILKGMNVEVTRTIVSQAPVFLQQRDRELDRLEDLYARVTEVLDGLESDQYDVRSNYIKEARLIVGTIKDIQYKLIKTMVWAELVKKIDEAVSNGCETCQKRIRGVLESVGRG